MTSEVTSAARPKLSVRTGASRKLLERKAAKKAGSAEGDEADGVEALFPVAGEEETVGSTAIDETGADHAAAIPAEQSTDAVAPPAEAIAEPIACTPVSPTGALPAPLPAAAPTQPAQVPTWSAEDESAFQALSAKRKAAGYQRRGKDVGTQLIRPGDITPNPNTVVAVIASLVADKGSISRADLIAAMGQVTFPHPKAQPADHGWCQGYIAGAIRNGFLSVDAGQEAVAQTEEAA